ncbi:DUF7344 domain-containing protein [Haloparvum sedimenti]|uniref:DUF7344 domain-containing protein n=1 Tax=Haloparvum sedimenti TaxID=1678448 RepID=UPI001FE0DBE9|nr:hypothetical protein [Haloparvum sedimenti]
MAVPVTLPETRIHALLSNERRQATLDRLSRADDELSVSDLATFVAERESGTSPPPRDVRESVYCSLVQTHLPTLEESGVVVHDADAQTVRLAPHAEQLRVYQEVVTSFGVTWAELYRTVGIVGLCAVLGSLVGAPGLARVDPLLWTSLALVGFAAVSVYHLWSYRFSLLG